MMRFWFALVLLVAIAIGLALFPSVASQMMTIEAMGWHLEMKQGLFLALLLLLLVVARLLLAIVRLLLRGPASLAAAWRNSGRRRQELRVQHALTDWANGEAVIGNPFAEAAGAIPDWLGEALAAWVHPGQKERDDEAPLVVALRGRRLSDPPSGERTETEVPLAVRREAVALWSATFPRSRLARERLLRLLEEEGDWQAVVETIDQTPRGVTIDAADARKAKALLQLAKREPKGRLERLRQAAKLAEDEEVIIALAAAYRDGDDLKSARTVLLDGVERLGSLPVARALLKQEAALDNPLLPLQMLEKRCRKQANAAQRWLLVKLSQQAEAGERVHHHLRLLKQMPEGNALAWEIEAAMHMENREWESAARCYQQMVTRG